MRQSDEPTDRERCEMEIIKSLMRSYFDIARKNFQVSRVLLYIDEMAPNPSLDRHYWVLNTGSIFCLLSTGGVHVVGGSVTTPTTPF